MPATITTMFLTRNKKGEEVLMSKFYGLQLNAEIGHIYYQRPGNKEAPEGRYKISEIIWNPVTENSIQLEIYLQKTYF